MQKKYRLELVGITYNQIESAVYALILQQVGTSRRIPIIIGYLEAQAIECKLQEVATPRPLTHDTMAASLAAFGISLVRVEIRKLPNGVFAADLVFSDGKIEKVIDSRSSDAVALAIRVGAPI
ncbi:MAG: bifunctional nuclease family protein, partial [Muribaculaceae bacterium]|nr:bifunctional nuclease family protein [Muribaculaceae bacterium]